MDAADTKFHLSQPPELFARIDQEPEPDEFGESIVMTTLGSVVNWGRKNAIWPMSFGLACCAIEMMSMIGSRFDISRFGAELVVVPKRNHVTTLSARAFKQAALPFLDPASSS